MASRLQDVILRGTAASRPAASAVAPGTLYYSTDTAVTERRADSSATWETYSDAGTGGGGNVTSTGAVGSEPGSPTAGDLYLPNNGIYLERSTGSVWAPWGPISPMTAPVDADFAWVNQGVASVDTTKGGIYLLDPAGDTGSQNYHLRVKTAPSTPYVITAALLPHLVGINGMSSGLVFRQSSDGKLHSFVMVYSGGWLWAGQTLSGPTGFNGTYFTNTPASWGSVLWFRIADNGTNRICSYSYDGQHFHVMHTVSRTDYLTANQVGFALNTSSSTVPGGLGLLSWKET